MKWTSSYKSFKKKEFERIGSPTQTFSIRNLENAGELVFEDSNFNTKHFLVQSLSIHSPSEHKFEGERRAAEVQFVNYGVKADGSVDPEQVAILAVTFEESEEAVSSDLGSEFIKALTINSKLDLTHVSFSQMPMLMTQLEKGNFFNYEGSLT